MKLMELIQQFQRTAGDPKGDEHLTGTVLQYLNEEIDYVAKEFPEKATFTWVTVASSYYHTIDFTGFPVLRVDQIMVNGIGGEMKRWKELRGSVGNGV
jgi:hypothetical protein